MLCCMTVHISCIRESIDPCPQGGGVEVTLRAEKFQAMAPYGPTDIEADFASRIHSLDYLLYDENGRLLERGSADDLPAASGDSYLMRHAALPFGSYRLVLAANTAERMMSGSPASPEDFYIVYQGERNGDDHFRAVLSLEVTCPCINRFETVLQRVHGVTRFRFENIPSEVRVVEVSLDNVGARIPLSGEPDIPCVVTKRMEVSELSASSGGSFTLGTFATLPGKRSAWRLKLYGTDETVPLYERLITDTLRIESNRLIDLSTRFDAADFNAEVEFRVEVDATWDGSNEGGGDVTVS